MCCDFKRHQVVFQTQWVEHFLIQNKTAIYLCTLNVIYISSIFLHPQQLIIILSVCRLVLLMLDTALQNSRNLKGKAQTYTALLTVDSYCRHGSGSDPYHAAPLNQNLGQYHQRRYTEGSVRWLCMLL